MTDTANTAMFRNTAADTALRLQPKSAIMGLTITPIMRRAPAFRNRMTNEAASTHQQNEIFRPQPRIPVRTRAALHCRVVPYLWEGLASNHVAAAQAGRRCCPAGGDPAHGFRRSNAPPGCARAEDGNILVTRESARVKAARGAESAPRSDYALTMQSGASLVSRYAEFDTLELYVRHAAMADGIAGQLGAHAAARGANLVIMVPYYRVSGFYGERRVRSLTIVSDLQLYLDLYDLPQRGREQAERIYERRIVPRLRGLEGSD